MRTSFPFLTSSRQAADNLSFLPDKPLAPLIIDLLGLDSGPLRNYNRGWAFMARTKGENDGIS